MSNHHLDLATAENRLFDIIMGLARLSDMSFEAMTGDLKTVTQLINELEQRRDEDTCSCGKPRTVGICTGYCDNDE